MAFLPLSHHIVMAGRRHHEQGCLFSRAIATRCVIEDEGHDAIRAGAANAPVCTAKRSVNAIIFAAYPPQGEIDQNGACGENKNVRHD
jgi:hypothetical protein